VHRNVDWGDPRPAEWPGPRETLTACLPAHLARTVRDRARSEGESVSVVMARLLENALEVPRSRRGAAHADLVTTLFD
jgi:hypothetical protein